MSRFSVPAPIQLVMASANPHKAAEMTTLLQVALGDRLELSPRPANVPEVDETGASLLDNARLKAIALVEATGTAAVADDTGLEVVALDGAPGVRSARFAGPDASYQENLARLLADLHEVSDRQARFRTVALVAYPGGAELTAEGVCEGTIALAPSGSAGFGYDPVFMPADGDGRTMAELAEHEKHSLSSRGHAFRLLGRLLLGTCQ